VGSWQFFSINNKQLAITRNAEPRTRNIEPLAVYRTSIIISLPCTSLIKLPMEYNLVEKLAIIKAIDEVLLEAGVDLQN